MTETSEGEAMLALADKLEKSPSYSSSALNVTHLQCADGTREQCTSLFEVLLINAAHRTRIVNCLRAAARSSGARVPEAQQALHDFRKLCRTDISMAAQDALARLIAAISPDTPREGEIPNSIDPHGVLSENGT